jgi:hypothetical protein
LHSRALARKSRDEWTVRCACFITERSMMSAQKKISGESMGLMRKASRNDCGTKHKAAALMKPMCHRAPSRDEETRNQGQSLQC